MMKIKHAISVVLVAGFSILKAQGPQIPNGSFDNWQNTYNPVSWTTIDAAIGATLHGDSGVLIGLAFEDTVDFVQGGASLKLVADTVFLFPDAGVVFGVASLGTLFFRYPVFTHSGVPFVFKPDTIFFSYKYTSPAQDTAGIYIDLTKDGASVFGARGITDAIDTSSTWKEHFVVLTQYYAGNDIPDTLDIRFNASLADNPVQGSTLHIDNAYFGYAHSAHETTSPSGNVVICPGGSLTLNAATDTAYKYYQWFFNGEPIAGANAASYAATDSGNYYVLIDSAGVPGKSDIITATINVNCVNGITDIAPAAYLNIYPNPATNRFTLTSNTNISNCNIRLLDVVGRQVKAGVLNNAFTNTIDVSMLTPGAYVVCISNKEDKLIAKNRLVITE